MKLKLKLKPLKISLELDDELILQLSDIFYVPFLRRNLISVSHSDMMDMIVILVMANVRLCLIINVLVLPSDKTNFIYYHFLRM